jgi:hypothetical protein
MIRQLDKASEDTMSWAVKFMFGRCPAGCGSMFPTGVIYRSSRRAVTLRCGACGIQWTMTAHQMAKAARGIADDPPPHLVDSPVATGMRNIAKLLSEWAESVDDKRGRRADTLAAAGRPARDPAGESSEVRSL